MSDTENAIPEHDVDERGLCVLFCPACHLDRETALRIEAAPLVAAAVAAETERCVAAALAFAENRMHRSWHPEMEAAIRARGTS